MAEDDVDIRARIELEDQERVEAKALEVSREASSLAAQIANTRDTGALSSLTDRLYALENAVPGGSKESGSIRSAIMNAKKQADETRREEEAKDTEASLAAAGAAVGIAGAAASFAFASATFNYMTQSEKNFLTTLDPELQADFTRIKFHSLSADDQGKIRNGKAASPDELNELRNSLRRMETHMQETDPEHNLATHAQFQVAHEQIDNVERLRQAHATLDTAAKTNPALTMNAKITGLALKFNEDKLGQVLKENIIDGTLLEHSNERGNEPTRNAGSLRMQVEDVSIGQATTVPPTPVGNAISTSIKTR